ncbi:MAG: hypothetical protein M3371_12420 [Acidobacteriota bacterium]|nr:hypothetical protein [Acidobacteriota bacterium]
MWQIKNPEIKPATLDFSSSAQGKLQVSQLFSGGIELINVLELVDWDSEDTQFLICEACGYTHCKSGDWVSIRKSNSLILILPASEYVWGERRDKEEYRPPYYLKKQGVAYLDLSTYESLRSKHSSFPTVEQIRLLNMREATLLFQWDAPSRVLGELPNVHLRRDIILASSEGDYVEYLKQLEALIQTQYKDESSAILRPISDSEQVISFYLDAEEFIEWKALVFDGSAYRLLADSRYVIAGGVAS